jgi:sorbitol-specific phosphotransferase system component IIC
LFGALKSTLVNITLYRVTVVLATLATLAATLAATLVATLAATLAPTVVAVAAVVVHVVAAVAAVATRLISSKYSCLSAVGILSCITPMRTAMRRLVPERMAHGLPHVHYLHQLHQLHQLLPHHNQLAMTLSLCTISCKL